MSRHTLPLLLSLLATLPAGAGAGEPSTGQGSDPLPPGALRRLPQVASAPLPAPPVVGTDAELLRRRTERMRTIREIRVSGDGKIVTLRKGDGAIQAWDLASGKLLREWRLAEKSMAATLSPDGKVVAVVDKRNTLVLHAADTGKLLRRFRDPLPGSVSCLAFAPDGKALISGHVEPAQSCTWDVASGRRLDCAAWADNLLVSAAASPDGAVLAMGSLEGRLRIWDRAARKPRCQHGIGSRIESLAFTADGAVLASVASHERCVRLWSTKTGQPVRFLPWRGPRAALVVFSPDGKLLTCCAGRSVLLWEAATGRVRQSFSGHEGPVTAAAFTADGKRLVTGGRDGVVLVWDLTAASPTLAGPGMQVDQSASSLPRAARARLGSLSFLLSECRLHREEELRLAFSSDGALLFIGVPPPAAPPAEQDTSKPAVPVLRPAHGPPGIRAREVSTGKEGPGLEDVPEGIDCLACSPDGRTLAALVGPTLHLWDIPKGTKRKMAHINLRRARALLYTPDSRLLAVAGEDHVGLFDADSGRCVHLLQGDPPGAVALAFSPDGKELISCSRPEQGKDERHTTVATVWDVAGGKCLQRRTFSADGALGPLCLSPEGSALAAGEGDRMLHLWNISGAQEQPQNLPATTAVAFSPDGKLLATADEKLRLLDRTTARQLVSLRWANDPVRQMLFSPDGKLLALVAGGRLHLWDVARQQEVVPHEGHNGAIAALVLSADGKLLLSGGADRSLCLWDAATGKMLHRIHGHEAAITTAALSPDGKRAASIDADGWAFVWDTATGRQLLGARMHPPRDGAYRQHVAFTADGQSLLIADLDGLVEIRRLSSWNAPRFLPGPDHSNPPPALSADDRLLTLSNESFLKTSFISLQETSTGERRWHVEHPHKDGVFLAAAFPLQGSFAAVSRAIRVRDGRLRLPRCQIAFHESTTGKEVLTLNTGLPVSVLAFSPDGKMLATATGSDILRWERDSSGAPFIQLWDVRTGRPLGKVAGHKELVTALTFSADSRTLFSASTDGTILAWDVCRLPLQPPRRPHDLTPEQLQRAWDDLGGANGAGAWRTMADLSSVPTKTLSFLQGRLRPVQAVSRRRLSRLVADLDSDDFAVREEATRQLSEHVDQAESALRQALKERPTPEMRRRLKRILEQLQTSPEQQRAWRVGLLLDWIDTPEADKLLRTLAGGAADARLTREARVALERRARRQISCP